MVSYCFRKWSFSSKKETIMPHDIAFDDVMQKAAWENSTQKVTFLVRLSQYFNW